MGGRTHASYFNAGVRSGSLGGLCRFTQDHALLVKYINLFFTQFFKIVKNAEQVLFHSTLEPNTEVFSKVSCGVLRSTKFHLNFAKQRRNDMQPS